MVQNVVPTLESPKDDDPNYILPKHESSKENEARTLYWTANSKEKELQNYVGSSMHHYALSHKLAVENRTDENIEKSILTDYRGRVNRIGNHCKKNNDRTSKGETLQNH